MPALKSHITIGAYEFDFVHQVTIEKTWKNLTNTARIVLPAALKINANDLKKSIPVGSAVSIELGYEHTGLTERFKGFVTRVLPKVPVEIECQDNMWKLKQLPAGENAMNETVGSYLTKLQPFVVDAFDVSLPKYIVQKLTVAQVIDELKKNYGFPIFFRGDTLVIGKQYNPETAKKNRFVIEQVANTNVKANNLEYSTKDEIKLKVTAISNLSSGEKLEATLGDPEGEERTLNFYDLQLADLKKVAEAEIDRLRYDGFKGSFTAFGEPLVNEGDLVELVNDQDNDKTGTYWVDAVTDNFGVQTMGYEQVIQLGSKS